VKCPGAHSNVSGFATVGLFRRGYSGREADTNSELLRASSPEAIIQLDDTVYGIGGLVGQSDYAFLNASLLTNMQADPTAFVFKSHELGIPQKRYEWTPGDRFSDASAAWPPQGLTLELEFVAPAHAPASHAGVTVTVVYELFTGVPIFDKYIRVQNNGPKVKVNKLTSEVLYCTNEAMGYWAQPEYGALTSNSVSGRIHMQSELSRGGSTTNLLPDDRCTTCTQGNSKLVLQSGYPLGPGAEVGRLDYRR
jgi:hypothetical protein